MYACVHKKMYCGEKLLPAISVNNECYPPSSHQQLQLPAGCAYGEFRMEKNRTLALDS